MHQLSIKEGNVLFNDALNTFYLRLYGVRHMVKDRSDSERGNLLPPHGLFFPISSKGSFICIIPDRIAHTTAFVTPVESTAVTGSDTIGYQRGLILDQQHTKRRLCLLGYFPSYEYKQIASSKRTTIRYMDQIYLTWNTDHKL